MRIFWRGGALAASLNSSQYLERTEDCQLRTNYWVDSWRRARSALWGPTCVLCGSPGQLLSLDLCSGCDQDLLRNSHACLVCAEPMGGVQSERARLKCGACLRRPPRFDCAVCPFLYTYPLDHMVRGLKYRDRVVDGRVLGGLLATAIETRGATVLPQRLIPVPLAPRRFRERGFNQAMEIAGVLEHRLSIPVMTDLLERARDTAEQAGLDRRARRKNIRGAFTLRQRPAGEPVPGHVALVDDVVTTGSTANEIARLLRRAGVERIEVWAVARAAK